jgi:hypothetical protein
MPEGVFALTRISALPVKFWPAKLTITDQLDFMGA